MGVGDNLGRWEYRVMVSDKNGKCHKIDGDDTQCGYTPELYEIKVINTRGDHNKCGICFRSA